jgi:hypothetical protein
MHALCALITIARFSQGKDNDEGRSSLPGRGQQQPPQDGNVGTFGVFALDGEGRPEDEEEDRALMAIADATERAWLRSLERRLYGEVHLSHLLCNMAVVQDAAFTPMLSSSLLSH